MGKAIILTDCDFSTNNIGQVTFQNIPLQSLAVSGDSAILGSGTYTAIYTPSYTSQKGVTWSIVDGSSYAGINASTGVVTAKSGASSDSVTIRCTSTANSSIYADKTISVSAAAIANAITVTATSNSVSASLAYAAASALTITVGELGTIFIASGESSGTTSIATSSSERTANLSVSPASDSTYSYELASSTIVIPAAHNLMVVGPFDAIKGDVRAGNYFLLDLDTMKQVVGTSNEVTDDYKEYLGAITWAITEGSTYVSLEANSGTSGDVNILSGASSSNFTITAICDGSSATKSGVATYAAADLTIGTFAEMQTFASAVTNSQESTLIPSSTNGDGFVNKHIRLTADIDYNGVEAPIGSYTNDTTYKAFKGWFDGAGYELKNLATYVFGTTLGTSSKYCKLSNFTMSGSISIGPSLCRSNINYTELDRIYNKVNINRIESGNLMTWMSAPNGTYCKSTDLVVAGSINHVGNVRCLNSFGPMKRLAHIGTITTPGEFTIYGLVNNSSTQSVEDVITLGTYQGGSNKHSNIFSDQTANVSFSNVLVAGSYTSFASLGYFYWTGATQYNVNKTNCYYDSSISIVPQGTTSKTTSQIKSGSLFNASPWIEKQGYYPLIGNQFAIKPEMLAAIRK